MFLLYSAVAILPMRSSTTRLLQYFVSTDLASIIDFAVLLFMFDGSVIPATEILPTRDLSSACNRILINFGTLIDITTLVATVDLCVNSCAAAQGV
jgi:ABC-type transport system involved in cytochrome c biogenesis permease subunit